MLKLWGHSGDWEPRLNCDYVGKFVDETERNRYDTTRYEILT